jgi:adenosylmethionine-8-amino-7-oxononanoate aminotransferase
VVILMPPLAITEEELRELVATVGASIEAAAGAATEVERSAA